MHRVSLFISFTMVAVLGLGAQDYSASAQSYSTPAPLKVPATDVVVFDQDSVLMRLRPDGQPEVLGKTILGTDYHLGFSTNISRDGKRVLFNDFGGARQTFVVNSDGSGRKALTFGDEAAKDTPAWSPDSRFIAYTLLDFNAPHGSSELYIMDADGTNQKRIFKLPNEHASAADPAWSPDGKQIAFALSDGNDGSIWVTDVNGTDVDGTKAHRLSAQSQKAYVGNPVWSPDGKKIAFHSKRNGNFDIHVVNVDGTNEKPLTQNAREDRCPTWSPDGKQLMFTSKRNGNSDIYLMNADGSNQTQITFTRQNEDHPSWARATTNPPTTNPPRTRPPGKR